MVKVNVDVRDEAHYMMQRIQLDLEMQGDTKQLKELYAEAIEAGIKQLRSRSREKQEA